MMRRGKERGSVREGREGGESKGRGEKEREG